MTFMYPRTVDLHRPGAQTGTGRLGYGGATQGSETPVKQGVAASIQLRREGQRSPVGLPGDASRPSWDVFTRLGAFADGEVKDRDVMVDDLGRRFLVLGDYSDSMGGKYRVERLEA